jgi:hypothetical protein
MPSSWWTQDPECRIIHWGARAESLTGLVAGYLRWAKGEFASSWISQIKSAAMSKHCEDGVCSTKIAMLDDIPEGT